MASAEADHEGAFAEAWLGEHNGAIHSQAQRHGESLDNAPARQHTRGLCRLFYFRGCIARQLRPRNPTDLLGWTIGGAAFHLGRGSERGQGEFRLAALSLNRQALRASVAPVFTYGVSLSAVILVLSTHIDRYFSRSRDR
jgi:hypothetical protein